MELALMNETRRAFHRSGQTSRIGSDQVRSPHPRRSAKKIDVLTRPGATREILSTSRPHPTPLDPKHSE